MGSAPPSPHRIPPAPLEEGVPDHLPGAVTPPIHGIPTLGLCGAIEPRTRAWWGSPCLSWFGLSWFCSDTKNQRLPAAVPFFVPRGVGMIESSF